MSSSGSAKSGSSASEPVDCGFCNVIGNTDGVWVVILNSCDGGRSDCPFPNPTCDKPTGPAEFDGEVRSVGCVEFD